MDSSMHSSEEGLKGYKAFVQFRQQRNPCIGGLSSFLTSRRSPQESCTLYIVDLDSDPGVHTRLRTVHPMDLDSALETPAPGRGRVIIVEDLHPAVLETLGARLDIDPIFFADYVLTSLDNIENAPAPPSVALAPSQIQSQGSWFHMHYQQVIDLGQGCVSNSPWVLKTRANVPRSVRRLPQLQGRRQLGIARACCSILTKHFQQSWIGLVLVDSTTTELVLDPEYDGPQPQLRRAALRDGFEDFQNPPSFASFRSSEIKGTNSSNSLLNLLLSYYSSDASLALQTSNPSPLTLACPPLRFIVGEWNLYSQLVARYLKHYEYCLNDTRSMIPEDEFVDLQKWRHRAVQTKSKLDATRDFISHRCTFEPNKDGWDLLVKDFSYLSDKIERYGQSLERIIPVATAVLQLGAYRSSVSESVYIRRLTYMALIFVPLSWVAAVFSMGNEFAPGQPLFWVYFAVSFPFCLVFFVTTVVLSKSGSVKVSGVATTQRLLYAFVSEGAGPLRTTPGQI